MWLVGGGENSPLPDVYAAFSFSHCFLIVLDLKNLNSLRDSRKIRVFILVPCGSCAVECGEGLKA